MALEQVQYGSQDVENNRFEVQIIFPGYNHLPTWENQSILDLIVGYTQLYSLQYPEDISATIMEPKIKQ